MRTLVVLSALVAVCACERARQALPSPGAPSSGPVGGGPPEVRFESCPKGSAPLNDTTRTAIERALREERVADANYGQVVSQFGAVAPFASLARNERKHAGRLEQLLAAHGAPVPSTTRAPAIAYQSLATACTDGVAVEKANIALYEQLLATELPDDVRCVFVQLQRASRESHLPALARCATKP